jgi:hypothetical protein
MRIMILSGLLLFLTATAIVGLSQATDNAPIINLMILPDLPQSATKDQANATESSLEDMYSNMRERDLSGTIFSTQNLIASHARLPLTRMGLNEKFELGMSGSNSDEKMSKLSYTDQRKLLQKSLDYVEACKVCGLNNITAKGFIPPSFDQNQDTYKALDDLGIKYDAGFQAGVLYAPGHENDVWPYQVEGHKFYAVPVSTDTISGKKIVLMDKSFKDDGMSASQWYDAMVGKLDQIQGKDEPMVIIVTTSVSGSGDYMDALKNFLDYAISKKASFVTTSQLVEMAKTGIRDVSALPPEITSEGCATCGKNQEGTNVTISATNINRTATSQENTTEKTTT